MSRNRQSRFNHSSSSSRPSRLNSRGKVPGYYRSESGFDRELDKLARLQILEGALGVPSGLWTGSGSPLKVSEGLKVSQAFCLEAGKDLDPQWFSLDDVGFYASSLRKATGVLYKNSKVDVDDVMQNLMTPAHGKKGCQSIFWQLGASRQELSGSRTKFSLHHFSRMVSISVYRRALDAYKQDRFEVNWGNMEDTLQAGGGDEPLTPEEKSRVSLLLTPSMWEGLSAALKGLPVGSKASSMQAHVLELYFEMIADRAVDAIRCRAISKRVGCSDQYVGVVIRSLIQQARTALGPDPQDFGQELVQWVDHCDDLIELSLLTLSPSST